MYLAVSRADIRRATGLISAAARRQASRATSRFRRVSRKNVYTTRRFLRARRAIVF